jgi:hypothetical protein
VRVTLAGLVLGAGEWVVFRVCHGMPIHREGRGLNSGAVVGKYFMA